jgi:hypothetical protein
MSELRETAEKGQILQRPVGELFDQVPQRLVGDYLLEPLAARISAVLDAQICLKSLVLLKRLKQHGRIDAGGFGRRVLVVSAGEVDRLRRQIQRAARGRNGSREQMPLRE